MAHSRKSKRRSSQPSSFYEALPLAFPPSRTLPHVAEHIEEAASAAWNETRQAVIRQFNHLDLRALWHERRKHATHVQTVSAQVLGRILRQSRATGRWLNRQASTHGVQLSQQTVQVLSLAANRGRGNVILAGQAAGRYAGHYGPAIAWDLNSGAHAGAKLLSGRRAKLIYLALIIIGGTTTVAGGVMLATKTLNSYANDLSSPAVIMAKKKTGTTILDRNGEVLFEGYGAQASRIVELDKLPASLKDATLAAEDPSFYNHPGFSWEATARAAWVDITQGKAKEGGSTLTQQLVKNTLLTHDKNFERKFQELLLAMKIEQRYTKDEILQMYLNSIYYGQGSSGVQAASQTYFHKNATDLTLGESALMAGLPLGPSRFDPNFDLEAATGRRNYVLGRMAELGKITKAEADTAKAQPIILAGSQPPPPGGAIVIHARSINLKAPHFVFYVLGQLRQLYGDELVEHGGITVKTTLDLSKQQAAEAAVTKRINELSGHHVTNAGLISIEPATGHILAMVGSVNYNAPGFGNVNVTLSQLQPGSSFKPIAYVTAFKKGWNGSTRVDDTPLSVPNTDGTFYTPQNYSGRFSGPVTLRHALDNSLNIPAVRVLQFAGIHDTIQTAHDLGITSLQDESRYGLALVLGGGEVRPIDMATVYATFANGGTKVPPRAIVSVSNRLGEDITKPPATTPKSVLDPRHAFMITHILSDNPSRAPSFPVNSPLKLSRPAAAKTGTTNDFRDNWTVGYTPQIATAVWVGNNDHSPMQNVDGITGAAPIWHDYMEAAHAELPIKEFDIPNGLTLASVCSDGAIAEGWSTGTIEVFLSEAIPTHRCHPQQPDPGPTPQPSPDPNLPPEAQAAIDEAKELLRRGRDWRETQPVPLPFFN